VVPSRPFRLDDFERGPLLGKGFFSDVHLVTHKGSKQRYALKTLKEAGTEESKMAFLKEVELLNSLRHPSVLCFRGLFIDHDGYHLLTDLLPFGPLRKLLKDPRIPLSDRQRAKLSLDIAQGMAAVHSHNILHRDLKSKNILLRSLDSAVIADFGLAKLLDSSHAETRSMAGSPYWMAPEIFRNESYGKPVDVFSFGIVLCEIITRLKAEPDVLPRTKDFGLDVQLFLPLTKRAPKALVDLAVDCCRMAPAERPTFVKICSRLEPLLTVLQARADPALEREGEELFRKKVREKFPWAC